MDSWAAKRATRFLAGLVHAFLVGDRNYRTVRGNASGSFIGLHVRTGVRSRFRVVEHSNIGRGWMMRDVDSKVPGIVSERELYGLRPCPQEDSSTRR